jgi:hypothetical protein
VKTRPWFYVVELRHHDNTNCTQPRPLPGRGLLVMRGTGDRPLCEECAQLDAEFSAQQLHQLAGTLQQDATEETGTKQAEPEQADLDASESRKQD